jgi:hypothetical protein
VLISTILLVPASSLVDAFTTNFALLLQLSSNVIIDNFTVHSLEPASASLTNYILETPKMVCIAISSNPFEGVKHVSSKCKLHTNTFRIEIHQALFVYKIL